MTNNKASTSFTKQNENEKQSRLLNITKSQGEVVVWEKGSEEKEKMQGTDFNKKSYFLTLSANKKSKLYNKKVLYTFQLNGVSYFGQGELKAMDSGLYSLNCSEDLFKSERRDSYRLLTYPHLQVYVHIPVTVEDLKKSNLVNINTKMSQTGLFNNFLEIVGDDENENQMREGFMRFRVLDISVTGLAFQVTDLEKKYIDAHKEFNPIHINFNGIEMMIPKSEVRYNIPLLKKNGKAYKVGLKFLEVDTNIDEMLGKQINEALRDFDSEFEDFI